MTHRIPFFIQAVLVALLSASTAGAQNVTAPTAVTNSAKVNKKDVDPRLNDQTIVCKREDVVGTRLGGSKVCHTRAEWNSLSAEAHEQASRMINTPQIP